MRKPHIPIDPIGYSVAGDTIHTRYADHGNGTRTRTEKGAITLLDGRKPKTCPDCYPSPQYNTPAPPRAPQQRRTSKLDVDEGVQPKAVDDWKPRTPKVADGDFA